MIGKRCAELWDIDQAWDAFISRTKLPVTSEYLQHKRDIGTLIDRLQQTPNVLVVSSEDTAEPYGFVISIIKNSPDLACRALIIKNQKAWDHMSESKGGLILIPYGFTPENVGYALSNGHHVVRFSTITDAPEDSWKLPRLNRIDRSDALKLLGFEEVETHEIFSETLGYFSPLCRSRFLNPVDRGRPDWVETDSAVLIAAFLCFEWDDQNENDQKILEQVSGYTYSKFVSEVQKLACKEDPFIRKIGNVWQVISRMDAWFYLRTTIDQNVIVSVRNSFFDVLSEINPALDLPAEEQYMAAVKGMTPKYSGVLKNGLSHTLALLSLSEQDGIAHEVERIGEEIFSAATTSKYWMSLDRVMRLLCEAHPDACLSAIERQISTGSHEFVTLFNESNSSIFGACKYAELLWTLEVVAGGQAYFARAVICLAELASLDPGTSSYSNSPLGSLVGLFLGWVNNIGISHDDRIAVIENVLIPRFPHISWELIKKLVRPGVGSTSGVSKATFRDWALGIDRNVDGATYRNYISKLTVLWLESFVECDLVDPQRLRDVMDNLASLDHQRLDQLESYLLSADLSTLPIESREACANRLRHFVARHREFPDANWSAPEELLERFEVIFKYFEISDVQLKNKHLFESYRVDFIQPSNRVETPIADQNQLVDEVRIAALIEIFEDGGVDGVMVFIEMIEKKNKIGYYLGQVDFALEIEEVLIGVLDRSDDDMVGVAKSYFSSVFHRDESELIRVLNCVGTGRQNLVLKLLLCARLSDTLLSIVHDFGSALKIEYWQKMDRYLVYEDDVGYLSVVATGLMSCDRYAAALKAYTCVITRKELQDQIDIQVLANILYLYATTDDIDEAASRDISYELCEAIKLVQESKQVKDDQKRQIEWLYAYPLKHQDFTPKVIIEALKNDPKSFANFVCWLYRSRDEAILAAEEKEDSEMSAIAMQNRANTAMALIDAFAILPGASDEDIDSEHLKEWVQTVRTLLKAKGRVSTGDISIGNLLARSPSGRDGHWPHESVRNVIEIIGTEELEQGIYVEVKNARGVVSKAIYEGGEQERELASKYLGFSEALQMVYPRTARILKKIADSYDHDARYSDNRVDLTR